MARKKPPPPDGPAPTSRASSTRAPLYYTFANHMHWADMQWLWGYHVLPGSIRDMLRLIDETGARGNVNFDGVGYEKLACESPEALADLRAGIADGRVEPVGCTYGQPYGLFHGGESNVRQFTQGVRAVRRLLGVRPRGFWEEEFCFFPQLPQMLVACGYTGACLFFQWTWHTPELPREPHALILWEGIDGSRLPALPRNDLNVHQWPEDFEGLLDRAWDGSWKGARASASDGAPAIAQWLELMPSRDWMCRSEVLLPRLKELFADERFEVRARTLSTLIEELSRDPAPPPVRRYSMDEAWHGMSLGKNADRHPRASRECERAILGAESVSALAGLLGRPYASWDVYPTWELDEAWRNTLAAQHHDNHECEGLCGFVGHQQFAAAKSAAGEVLGRATWLMASRAGANLRSNTLGWARAVPGPRLADGAHPVLVPPFGYAPVPTKTTTATRAGRFRRARGRLVLERKGLRVEVQASTGAIVRINHDGRDILGDGAALLLPRMLDPRGRPRPVTSVARFDPFANRIEVAHDLADAGGFEVSIALATRLDAIDVRFSLRDFSSSLDPGRIEPGFRGALRTSLDPGFDARLIADTPYAMDEASGCRGGKRKYPGGDWMTSPQWFEDVEPAIAPSSLIDLVGDEGGLLVCHAAPMQWFLRGRVLDAVLVARDPWDERRAYVGEADPRSMRLIPHACLTHAARARLAAEFGEDDRTPIIERCAIPVGGGTALNVERDVPAVFGALEVSGAPGVLAHAFFRESMKSGEHLPHWAGHRMFAQSRGACDHPYVVRLVEWNAEPAEVEVRFPGRVAMAAKTNLLGEVVGPRDAEDGTCEDKRPGDPCARADTGWLKVVRRVQPPAWAKGARLRGRPIEWSAVRFPMRPREIATIYADLVMGRKQWRDLDAKRKVWATVHRTQSRRRAP